MGIVGKFALVSGLIVLATAAGYVCRWRGWVAERVSATLMTLVVVGGFSAVGFLSVWKLPLRGADAWLPVLGAAHIVLITLGAVGVGRWLSRDRGEQGAFALTAGIGNNGFTMGGFVAYLLYGDAGLGLTSIYCLMAVPVTVLWFYPLARRFGSQAQGRPLGTLIRQSVLDWRSIGLPLVLLAVLLSPAVGNVPFPEWISRARVTDILMFATAALAYFAVGLRLQLSSVPALARMIVALGATRFVVGPALALGLLALTSLTVWPLEAVRQTVFMVVTVVPTSVTSVAVANMFDLRPREASVLFVANTVTYLLLVLPVVVWMCR
jgi:predicted permease